jgi:hypothetical protein
MAELKRYALWLLPDQVGTDSFASLIDDLSNRYKGPRFAPHVTLLGRVTGAEEDLTDGTEHLAQQLRVLTLRPQGIAREAYYFRCFYVKLEPSADLAQAHESAADTFGCDFVSDYLPHLSLIYGHLPRKEKDELRSEIEPCLPPDFVVNRLQLVHLTVSVADWHAVTTCSLQYDT